MYRMIYSLLFVKAIYLFVMFKPNHIQKIKNNFGLAVSFSYNIEYNHKKEISQEEIIFSLDKDEKAILIHLRFLLSREIIGLTNTNKFFIS